MIEHVTQEFLDLIKLPNPNARKLNYLIVMPLIVSGDDRRYQMPYGICMVSSALKASGRNVFTFNLNYKTNPYELLRQTIIDNSIDVVLTGGLSGQYHRLKEITDITKSVSSEIITGVGGGIITADPAVAMEAFETADYGIIGEGEITINAFAYALENDEDMGLVEGVVLRDGTVSPSRSEIPDLNILPFPDYDGFEYNMLQRDGLVGSMIAPAKSGTVATGRSCPYNCTFCFHSSGKKYRRRSIDNIFQEIDWIISKYNINFIVFIDELFVDDEKYVKIFTQKIKKRNIKYTVSARVDRVNKEMLQMLKDSGCYLVCYGVESANNHILKSMQKNITVEQIERAFALSCEVGLHAVGAIIFGDLEETAETISNSLNWWKSHPKYDITLSWILTFPGTYLYKVACKRGIISNRVKYLQDNDMRLNVSKMTDEQYWSMVNKVEFFNSLVSGGVDINLDNIDDEMETIGKNLDSMLKEHKIAVWPATRNIISMLGYMSPKFINSDNVIFTNINPNNLLVIGSDSFGKQVYIPDETFARGDVDTVLCACHSKDLGIIYNQISEMIKNKYPCVKRLVKLSELSKGNI